MSHPKKPTDVGTNRTGIGTAPLRAEETAAGAREGTPAAIASGDSIARLRAELSEQAPPLGSMPPPLTLKGAAKATAEALKGHKANLFLDKLGERLAFERTGVRLYEAVIAKVPAAKTSEGTLDAAELRHVRDEEHRHMHVVSEAIEKLGADPTAMTPCADLAGVQGVGLVQVVTDPRSTLTQCLDAILIAELADNDGWKVLIALAEALGKTDLAESFTQCLAEEDEHLVKVRRWLAERLEVQLGAKLPALDFGEPAQHP